MSLELNGLNIQEFLPASKINSSLVDFTARNWIASEVAVDKLLKELMDNLIDLPNRDEFCEFIDVEISFILV